MRVLDDNGRARGECAPNFTEEVLRRGLRAMEKTRAFDKRMLMAQRQGKTPFYFDISLTASGQCWSMTSYCPSAGPVAERTFKPQL